LDADAQLSIPQTCNSLTNLLIRGSGGSRRLAFTVSCVALGTVVARQCFLMGQRRHLPILQF
jgi:hypothetical protein